MQGCKASSTGQAERGLEASASGEPGEHGLIALRATGQRITGVTFPFQVTVAGTQVARVPHPG